MATPKWQLRAPLPGARRAARGPSPRASPRRLRTGYVNPLPPPATDAASSSAGEPGVGKSARLDAHSKDDDARAWRGTGRWPRCIGWLAKVFSRLHVSWIYVHAQTIILSSQIENAPVLLVFLFVFYYSLISTLIVILPLTIEIKGR
jgi:hypothetical protein